MAAVTASRSNPILAAFYQRLRTQSGKTTKVALVAVMRKMLGVLNKLIAQPNFSLCGEKLLSSRFYNYLSQM